nr:hypothetical protein [Tanacetum cinerariifolium]
MWTSIQRFVMESCIYYKCRAKSYLLLNNICEAFNGKIVKGRDKSVITLLEYIMEYYKKRIMNVQGVIDKCTGPLTPTATRIMESIKKEAHLMKAFNGKIVKGRDKSVITLLEYIMEYYMKRIMNVQGVIDKCTGPLTHTATRIMESGKKEAHLMKEMGIDMESLKHTLTRYNQLVGPSTGRSPHVQQHFCHPSIMSRKGRTITCQSCENTRHNNATCKGQGRKATLVGQDGLGGSDVGAVIGLSAGGEGGAGGPGVASQ